TVDLREKMEKRRKPAPPQKPAAPLEKIYRPDGGAQPDLNKIIKPAAGRDYSGLIRRAVLIAAVLIVGFTAYKLYFPRGEAIKVDKAASWYAVKLADGETFYGQVYDTKADPVVVNNAYYNYDQAKAKEEGKAIGDSGTLRLVKRGKEAHGPDGSLNIVRAQVLFLEPLKPDSAVLKAILEYEK
ncbi:MAG: hypothetical protein Q8O93_03030, partial [bacterium]|nr:hypothetical protein [bacterium]